MQRVLSQLHRGGRVRALPPNVCPIIRASDLGGVQVLKHNDLYLLSDAFGDVRPDSRGLGLYVGDTRIVSQLALRVNRERPVLLRTDSGANYRGLVQMTNADEGDEYDQARDPAKVGLARRSLGISRERIISDALYERVTISNFTQHSERPRIELLIDSDDADIFEVRGHERPARGRQMPVMVRDDGRVTFGYEGLDGQTRWTFIELSRPQSIVSGVIEDDEIGLAQSAVIVSWEQDVASESDFAVDWRIWTALTPGSADGLTVAAEATPPPAVRPTAGAEVPALVQTVATPAAGPERNGYFPRSPSSDPRKGAEAYREWTDQSVEVESDNELFDIVIRRSLADLRLLTNAGPSAGEHYLAAGIPWYTTLFGRDALISGLETLAYQPRIAIEALEVLARRQAVSVDDWRDAQPGKILHELRTGEMARTGELPYTPYYGSVDATPLWLILLSSVYEWTGDLALVDRLWPHALAALRWIDEYGTGKNGFLAYQRRSSQGLINQGWKDSGDSIIDRAGNMLEPPIALAEVQGYVYDAKKRLSRLAELRGETRLAGRLESEAEALKVRFHKAFWLADRRYYAMAIGKDGHVADAIGSNGGQCLWSGIVPPEVAPDVARRLAADDLDSGWGIRTLASGQPGYNPIGYHTGTLWPHDNALIAAGLKRYGLHEASNALSSKIFEAAQRFDDYRLPELFCGFARTASDPPVPYPVACSPQAWSAGAPLLFLSAMLGLRPDAAGHELELRQPQLPRWLSRVTMRGLRVGEATVDLLFHSWRGTTSVEVLGRNGELNVTIRI